MVPFVVTGVPRSTTKWTAFDLTLAGLPCQHEEAIRGWTDTYGDDQVWQDSQYGESSWIGAPFTDKYRAAGVPVVHVIRDPLDVVTSLVGTGLLSHPDVPFNGFINAHTPNVFTTPDGPERALRFWIDWNNQITADMVWRAPANSLDMTRLADLMGVKVTVPFVAPMNSRHRHPVSVSDLPQGLWAEAVDVWDRATA